MADFVDFYIKGSDNVGFNPTQLENKYYIDVIVSKISMLLLANDSDVYGEEDYGTNIIHFLWKTSFPASTIQQRIVNQIQNFIPELDSSQYNVNVSILSGTVEDIGIVVVNVGETSINFLFN